MDKKEDINKGRLIGAHCSIAGGFDKAALRGGELHCSAIQIFTKNSNQWKAAPITSSEIDVFKTAVASNDIKIVFAHAGYLINLATVDPEIHERSMESMRSEIERAAALGLPYIVVHPGSHKEAGEMAGIMQLVENLRRLRGEFKGSGTQIVLETTAGQGASIGYSFGHFAEIFSRLDWPADMGVCIDTAHIFQAGYDISTKKGYDGVMAELDEVIGLDYVRAIHVNDSKTECGSRSDRHEQIGNGKIGEEAFKALMADRRFAKMPMVIETPKGEGLENDDGNLGLLRSFI